MINIGDMNKKIEIYGFGWDKDELGQKNQKRKVNCQSMGKSSPDPIFRINQAYENEATEEMQFTIRYRKGIDKNMKIRYKDQMYGIDSVENENEADRFLILHAEAVEDENKSENNICRYI